MVEMEEAAIDKNTGEDWTLRLLKGAGVLKSWQGDWADLEEVIIENPDKIIYSFGKFYGLPELVEWWDTYIINMDIIDEAQGELEEVLNEKDYELFYEFKQEEVNAMGTDYATHVHERLNVIEQWAYEFDVDLPEMNFK